MQSTNKTKMETLTLTLIFVFLTTSLHLSTAQTNNNVKAGYWFPDSGVDAASIKATLFTHLLCAFADLNASTNQITISSSCSSFTATVRKSNPSIITLLSIGGGSADPSNFSSMASQPSSRKTFIDSSISLARQNDYSGLDLDWEYPATTDDMNNLGSLVTEWRATITEEAQSSGKSPLLLIAAVSPTPVTPNLHPPTYPVSSLNSSMDWLNIMAYDFHSPSNILNTSAHAALNDPSGGASGSAGITAWINAGMPASKLVFGFPFYGYAWALSDEANHGLGAPATGAATCNGIDCNGIMTFSGIKGFIRSNSATTVFNVTVVVNYCYAGKTWIGYDDVDAVTAKVSFVKNKNLRGYFAWSLHQDDNWLLSQTASTTMG